MSYSEHQNWPDGQSGCLHVQTSNINAARTRPTFQAVYDSRKRKVPGLWKRGARFYAQLRINVGNGRTSPRRIALEASDLTNARAELERKRTERRDNKLDSRSRRPGFESVCKEYFVSAVFSQKKCRTQDSQRQAIARWIKHLGGTKIDQIALRHIDDYRSARLREGTAARTVNIDVIALRQVLAYAKMRGQIDNIIQFFSPRHGGALKALPQRPAPKRRLLTKEQFYSLTDAATPETTKNAAQLRYYLRFLALTGAREREALSVARRDVDFASGFVMIGAAGDSKNSRSRTVDFSPELEALLRELEAALPPDTRWLFPSPQRGSRKDIHSQTLRESFKFVREKAQLQWVGFHEMRHFFASQCVMAGIDFMTIAEWLGHSDGGILVGKVYGHLAAAHKQEAARKLRFFN
jgi:integrase